MPDLLADKMVQDFSGQFLEPEDLLSFLSEAARRFGWTANTVVSYCNSPLKSLSSHQRLLRWCAFVLSELRGATIPLPLLPLEDEKYFCLLTPRNRGAEKVLPGTQMRRLCNSTNTFVHPDFPLRLSENSTQFGFLNDPTVAHVLAYMRAHHSAWDLKGNFAEISVSDEDVEWVRELWGHFDKLEGGVKELRDWAIVPTLNRTLIPLWAREKAVLLPLAEHFGKEAKAALSKLGVHLIDPSIGTLSQKLDNQSLISLLLRNRSLFSHLSDEQRGALLNELQFCDTDDLLSLPLFQNIRNEWIALNEGDFVELTEWPKGIQHILSRVISKEYIPLQTSRIRAHLGARLKMWNEGQFMRHIFAGIHPVFNFFAPSEKQVVLASMFRSKVTLTDDLKDVAFISHNLGLLRPREVYDDSALTPMVELLGLPRISSFFAEQLTVLQSTDLDAIRNYWLPCLKRAGLLDAISLRQFRQCATMVAGNPDLAGYSLALCEHLCQNEGWWRDEDLRNIKFVQPRQLGRRSVNADAKLESINNLFHPNEVDLVYTQADFLPGMFNLFPGPKVPVAIVLSHLEKVCEDFVLDVTKEEEEQLLGVFDRIFSYLNDEAGKSESRKLIATLEQKRVWPLALVMPRAVTPPQRSLLATDELCFDMELSPYVFRVAADSRLADFQGLLRAAGVPQEPSISTLTRHMKCFEATEMKNPGRRLDVVLQICEYIAAEFKPEDREEVMLPCESTMGHVVLVPATQSIFIDSPSLYRRLSGDAGTTLRCVCSRLKQSTSRKLGAHPLSEVLHEQPVKPQEKQLDLDLSKKLTSIVNNPELLKYLNRSLPEKLLVKFVHGLKAELILIPGVTNQDSVNLGASLVPWCIDNRTLFIGSHVIPRMWEEALVQGLMSFLSLSTKHYRDLSLLCAAMIQMWPDVEGAFHTVDTFLNEEKPKANSARNWRFDEQLLAHPSLAGSTARANVIYLDEETPLVPSDSGVVSLRGLMQRQQPTYNTLNDFKQLCFRVLQGIGHVHSRDSWLGNLSPSTILVRELDSSLMALIDVHSPTENEPQFVAYERQSKSSERSLQENLRMEQDMYSFGAILLFSAPLSLQAAAIEALADHPHIKEFYNKALQRSKIPKQGTEHFTSLVTHLLSLDPTKRPSAEQALADPFFTFQKPKGKLPCGWVKPLDRFKMVEIRPGSDEYIKVQRKYEARGTHCVPRLKGVYRVQSPEHYDRFMLCRKQMHKKLGRGDKEPGCDEMELEDEDKEAKTEDKEDDLEKWLFHGTSQSSVAAIAECGMDTRLCGKNGTRWGKGIYFATDAYYSANDSYSRPDKNGEKSIFLSRVLVGKYTGGHLCSLDRQLSREQQSCTTPSWTPWTTHRSL